MIFILNLNNSKLKSAAAGRTNMFANKLNFFLEMWIIKLI